MATPIWGSTGILASISKSLFAERSLKPNPSSQTEMCKPLHNLFENFSPPENKPNIILLIVESLSSSDSMRFGGIYDKFPELDRLSSEGLIATNCLAQGQSTDFGLVALLTELVPLQYPNSSYDVFMLAKNQSNVIQKYKEHGYNLAFWASTNISFRGQKEFIRSLGFQSIMDTSELSFLKGDRSGAFFYSVPDERLYETALSHFTTLKEPYLLVLETMSSHEPILGSVPEETWKYVDHELSGFIKNLRKLSYDGIIIITGDHRKRAPPTKQEWDKFGESAPYRIPLVILGPGVQAGSIIREPLAQSDMLLNLAKLIKGTAPKDDFIVVPGLRETSLLGRRKTPYKVFEKNSDLKGAINILALGLNHEITAGVVNPEVRRRLLDYLFCYASRLNYCQNHICENS